MATCSVYVRFRRWTKQVVSDALVELRLTEDWQHMIDSTSVRGHSQAAGAKGRLIRRLLVDQAAALRVKPTPAQMVKDALLALSSRAEKDPTMQPFLPWWAMPMGMPRLLLADKGYDGDAVRQDLLLKGIVPVIPPKANRKNPPPCDLRAYKERNRIERMFNRLKPFPRIATRFDNAAKSFAAFLALAAATMCMPYFTNRT